MVSDGLTEIQLFISAINRADVPAITSMLAEDHRFVDSSGIEIHGREGTREAWQDYFSLIPDYHVEAEKILVDGKCVVILGTASGTYMPDGVHRPDRAWSIPAAWRAELREGKIAMWQVYADNEPIRRFIRGEGTFGA